MELYLMRHGIAEDGEPGQPDFRRKLTAEGKEKAEAVLRLARRGGLEPTLILSSPFTRACQTARIAADQLGYKGEIVRSDTLTPNGSPEDVWRELRAFADERSILITSHEPLLGSLIAYLLNSSGLQVEVKKAAIFRVEIPTLRGLPRGVLQWMITPKISLEGEK